MCRLSRLVLIGFMACSSAVAVLAQGPTTPPGGKPQAADVNQWEDEFSGSALDETKWERFSFEGGGGGKLEVKDGELHLRSSNKTRSGVRSKESFESDAFRIDAKVARVGPQLPEAGDKASPIGFAALTVLFDGTGRNRIEWILTSEGTFEAWSVVDGRGERLDNRKLGTKMKNPVLVLIRRGDEFRFAINGPDSPPQEAQVGLTKTVKNMPRSFHVMLYGYGSSENDWDSVRVITLK